MEQNQTKPQDTQPKEEDKVVDLIELLRTAHDLILIGTFPLRYAKPALSVVQNMQQVIKLLEANAPATDQPAPQDPAAQG